MLFNLRVKRALDKFIGEDYRLQAMMGMYNLLILKGELRMPDTR